MAIDELYFKLLAVAIKMQRNVNKDNDEKIKIGCLSYPDLLIDRKNIEKSFPEITSKKLKLRNDLKKIQSWHGVNNLSEIIETNDFFEKINCEADYFDFFNVRGFEKIIDLNYPMPQQYNSQYDLVIDTGTLEHCFNVGIAFENMCKLVSIEGLIITAAPMIKINHGFWNFSPCAYENYFVQNNFKILHLAAYYKDNGDYKVIDIDPNARKKYPSESVLICIVRRLKNSTFNFPIQKKYL